jgi:transposase InsO family protein
VDYIDQHRAEYGDESICSVLPIAPSTYYDHKDKQRQPEKRSARAKRDEVLALDIQRVWEENFRVYGVRKVWRQLAREDIDVARSTVERLMKMQGLRGVVSGRRVKTALPSELAERPLDLVNRDFKQQSWKRSNMGKRYRLWQPDLN